MTALRGILAVLGLAALASASSAVGPSRAQDATPAIPVRIATEAAFPPYAATDANGNLVGFEIDLGNAICAETGWSCTWVVTDWDGIIPGLDSGQYDVIMAGMAITPARAGLIDFSRAYFPRSSEPAIGMFVGTHTFQTPEDALIAVQAGTIHAEHCVQAGLRVVTFPTALAAFQAVLDGTADLTFGSPDFLRDRVYRTGRALAILGTQEIAAGGPAAGFRKSDSALRDSFNQALEALDENGLLDRLNRKWFTPARDT